MATKKKAAKKKAPAKKGAPSRAKAKAAPKRKAAARKPKAPKKPGKMRLASVSNSYTVNDLGRSLAFYTDVLGFAVTQRWERDGELRGVEVSSGDVVVMIGQDDWQKGRDRKKGEGFRAYWSTNEDVDRLAEAIRSKGGTIAEAPRTEFWGRFFSFEDPDGFKITVLNERPKKK